MESLEKMKSSLDYMSVLARENCGEKFSVDYSRLDGDSKKELKSIIDSFIIRRRSELTKMVIGTNTNY